MKELSRADVEVMAEVPPCSRRGTEADG